MLFLLFYHIWLLICIRTTSAYAEAVLFSDTNSIQNCSVKTVDFNNKWPQLKTIAVHGLPVFSSFSVPADALIALRIKPATGERKEEELDKHSLYVSFLSTTTTWKLPVFLEGIKYYDAEKVLCPDVWNGVGKNTTVTMLMHSSVVDNFTIELYIGLVLLQQYKLGLNVQNRGVVGSAVEPKVYFANLTEGNLQLVLHSQDDYCAALFVQKAECPLIQTINEASEALMFLTYTTKARVILAPTDKRCGKNTSTDRMELPLNYVTLLVKSIDMERSTASNLSIEIICRLLRWNEPDDFPPAVDDVFLVENTNRNAGEEEDNESVGHRTGTLISFGDNQPSASFPPAASTSPQQDIQGICSKTEVTLFPFLYKYPTEEAEIQGLNQQFYQVTGIPGVTGAIDDKPGQPIRPLWNLLRYKDPGTIRSNLGPPLSTGNVSCLDSCILTELGTSGQGARLSAILTLDDERKDFAWYQVVVFLFSFLIIVLLTETFIDWRDGGNADICYHNFDCAHPFWKIRSFNNFISNTAYILMGLAFIVFVMFEKSCFTANLFGNTRTGPSRQFGILIAMGLTLISVGVCSAIYHVCPNRFTVEFDMLFIYILLALCLLKLFTSRHGSSRPNFVYPLVAVIVIVSANISEHQGSIWILFIFLQLFLMPFLSLQVYYNGHVDYSLTAGRAAARSLCTVVVDEFKHGHWGPLFAHRLVILFGGNILNFVLSLVIVLETEMDIHAYLFGFMLINLLIYFVYYMACKLNQRESVGVVAICFIMLAVVFWIAAALCYIHPVVDWKKTAAESRSLNAACFILDFFDLHDIWHLCSAAALFYSLLFRQLAGNHNVLVILPIYNLLHLTMRYIFETLQ